MRYLMPLVAALLYPSTGSASNWGTYSGWEVVGDESDQSCSIARDFEGPGSSVLVLVAHAQKSSGAVLLSNSNWTIERGERVRMAFDLEGIKDGSYEGNAYGFRYDGRGAIGLSFPDLAFLADFAQASGIDFFRVEGEDGKESYTAVDQLRLDGTGAAISAMRRCLSHQRQLIAAADAEKKRWEHIPGDPFSKPKAVSKE